MTDLMSVGFGLLLAALALVPSMIGIYLERRAQRRHGGLSNGSRTLAAYPPPVPFNYPLLVIRETPGEPAGPDPHEADEEDPADWWKAG